MDKDASQMDKVSYALCLRIGQQLKSMRVRELCVDDFAQGVRCVLEDKEPAMSHHDVQAVAIRYFREKEAKGRLAKAEKSEKLLKENSRKEGVTASGLQYRGIARRRQQNPGDEGSGALPLREQAPQRDSLRQQPATRRADRLSDGLRRRRGGEHHPAIRHIDFRYGTH